MLFVAEGFDHSRLYLATDFGRVAQRYCILDRRVLEDLGARADVQRPRSNVYGPTCA